MEMEFRDDRRRGKIVIALGVVLALVAGGGAYYAVNQAQQQAGQGTLNRVPAVVALAVIPARQPITADMVTVREVPLDDTNLMGVTTSVDQVVGRLSAVAILQGQLVTTNMLLSSSEGAGFSILGPDESVGPDSEYWRAVSITVPDDLAVGGMLQAGQTVDIFVTTVVSVPPELEETGRYYSDRATKITYQNVLILARAEAFYVMRANIAVAEEIAHLQASGTATFSMALRPDIDQRSVDATGLGETTNLIIARYGLPIPQVLEPGSGSPRPTRTPAPTPAPPADPSGAPPSSSPSPAP